MNAILRRWTAEPSVILALLLAPVFGLVACSSGERVRGGSQITFQSQSHNFGQVSARQKVEHQFLFQNTGTRELEILQVQVTSGESTMPVAGVEATVSAMALNPGGSGAILVTLNQPPIGRHDLRLQVRTNDRSSPELTLTMQVEVVP